MGFAAPRGPRPDPPPDLSARDLPVREIQQGEVLHRIHRSLHLPLFFGPPTPVPEFRWDDPGGEYKVCYLGEQREAAFVETLLREPRRRVLSWRADIEVRALARIEVLDTLRLAAFDGPGLHALGATLEVLGTREYSLPWAWSRALWEHPAGLDGIVYPCRHDNSLRGIALFDRAAVRVALRDTSPLARQRAWLGSLAVRYRFGLVP